MGNLIELIKKQQIGLNVAASNAKISVANLKLKKLSLPTIPEHFASLLQNFDGLSNEGSLIFGVEIESTLFIDLVKFNKAFFHENPSKWIILGYDECFYLIFDSIKKQYHIVDRDTFEPHLSSEDIAVPVAFLMRIDENE